MPRITLADVRQSALPAAIGLCAGDTPAIASAVNEAQERLINAGGPTGWWLGWARAVFSASVANPYVTLPRQFSTFIGMDVCRRPIRINNPFYEILPDGIGLMPRRHIPVCWDGNIAGYERGVFPTMVDLPTTSILRAYITDARDVGARMLITGLDQNGNQIYFQDVIDNVNGFFLTFVQPFVDSTFTVSSIQAVQKDITFGDVILKAVDPTTGIETTLSRYGPTEQNPGYRRYLITVLPPNCCFQQGGTTVQITGLAKLAYVPAYLDSDQLVICNMPALIDMCQSIRYSRMDVPNAVAMTTAKRKSAIRELQNELRSMLGEQNIAANVDTFGTARLEDQRIGTLI